MQNYRVLIFDRNAMTATIQFEGREPLNYNLPIVDGELPTGAAWDFWVQSLYLADRPEWFDAIPNVTNTAAIEALVNPVPFPVTETTAAPAQAPAQQPVTVGLEQV